MATCVVFVMICSKNTDESLDECRRVQTSADECRQVQTSHQTSLDECRRVWTNVDNDRQMQASLNESSIFFFFDINGGFPWWMFISLRRFSFKSIDERRNLFYIAKISLFNLLLGSGFKWLVSALFFTIRAISS